VSDPHIAEMRATFERLVAYTDLDDRQRDFFTARWLEQVVWMEERAVKSQRLYYRLRLVTVVGAVTVPTLLGLAVYGGSLEDVAKVVALCTSLLVAVCAAVEGFFQFGQRWRSYRGTLERLKTEGWLFLEQAGPYAESNSHSATYAAFAARVEELIRTDVDVYLTEVAVEKQPPKDVSKEG
jgi:hypothetical protein